MKGIFGSQPKNTAGVGDSLVVGRDGWFMPVWFALLCCGGIFLAPRSIGLYVVYAIVLGIAFLIVVFIKGERARWRWGKD